jgi:hypothetical protein
LYSTGPNLFDFYLIVIIVIGAFLFGLVTRFEPNPVLAILFEIAIIVTGGLAIANGVALNVACN